MNRETEEALRKAAEYSEYEKERLWRKCRWIPLLGGVGVPLCRWMRELAFLPEGVAECAAGILCGAMIAGVVSTSPAFANLRRSKQRLWRRLIHHEEE